MARRKRQHRARREAELAEKGADLVLERAEARLGKIDEVEFVDGNRDLLEPQQGQQLRVAPRLLLQPFGRIHHQHRGIGPGRAAHHVGEEFAMTRRVDDDEVAAVEFELVARRIDGDGLVALGCSESRAKDHSSGMPRRSLTRCSSSTLPSGSPPASCSSLPITVDLP